MKDWQQNAGSEVTVRVLCPDCGEVTLAIADLEMEVWAHSQIGSYMFGCPDCTQLVTRPAGRDVVRILSAEGVRTRVHQIPAEVGEHPPGPPLTWDDLLDLHRLLEADDWFDQLRG